MNRYLMKWHQSIAGLLEKTLNCEKATVVFTMPSGKKQRWKLRPGDMLKITIKETDPAP